MIEKFLKYACSGMFSDELDKMGYRNQVIDGLRTNNHGGKIYGMARTVKLETIETDDENIREGLGFLGKLEKGEILCVEASSKFAYFGELMSRLSIRQGLGGIVIGGLTRDGFFTHKLDNLTVYSEGYSPRDIKGRGRVQATDVDIAVKGLKIRPGDWIFADMDGIVVIPKEARCELEKRIDDIISNEGNIISDINNGVTVAEILNRYKEF